MGTPMVDLYSRTVRIGGPDLAPGCGYRDITIHEMTESEIDLLKTSRWVGVVAGFALGVMCGGAFVLWRMVL